MARRAVGIQNYYTLGEQRNQQPQSPPPLPEKHLYIELDKLMELSEKDILTFVLHENKKAYQRGVGSGFI